MVYFEVTKDNARYFGHLVPESVLDEVLLADSVYAIGAAENECSPSGVICFSYEQTKTAGEDGPPEPRLRLLWIYVDSKKRGLGIGTALFRHFIRSIRGLKKARVVIDVPQGGEREGLAMFLEGLGFFITQHLHYEVDFNLSDLRGKKLFKGVRSDPDIFSVKERHDEFVRYVESLPDERRWKVRQFLPIMEEDVSVVGFDKETPVATLVFVKRGPDMLDGVFLDLGQAKMGVKIFGGAFYMAVCKYPGTTRIRASVTRPATRHLLTGLFPDMHPRLYWHGRMDCIITREA